jgi:hypothetical protein
VGGEFDERIDGLYAGPPEEFVAARTALAKELRAAGDKEAADEVTGLRRPTLAAWALNQAGRRDPKGMDSFVAAAETLREAQDRALAGDRTGDLRNAVAERREAAARVVRAAAEAMRDAGRDPDPHLPAMAATVDAAAADPEVGELLRQGRLGSEHAPVGFGMDEVGAAPRPRARRGAPTPKSRRRDKAGAEDDAAVARRTADAEARAEAARQEAAAAARALKTAERNASAASAAVTKARQRVDDLDAKLRAARAALQESERSERSAHKELDAARRRHPAAGRNRGS